METPDGEADYFDGAVSSNGLIFGTYIHGLFHNDAFTKAFINRLRQIRGLPLTGAVTTSRQENYDKLAEIVRQNLDMASVYRIITGRDNG
jgi:adenosylcobyric acid synthase